MKKLVYSLLVVSVGCVTNAQSLHSGAKSRGSGGDLSTLMHLRSVVQTKGIMTKNDESIDGTLYLFPKWESLNHIYVTEEKGYAVETLNYNLVSKTLESKIAADSVYQFSSDKIAFVKRNNRNYRYYNINNSNELYQEIYKSKKITLVKGFELELIKSRISPMTSEVLARAKYIINDKFFYRLNDAAFVLLEPKKKNILNLFKDKSAQIEKYVKDNKMGYSTENDLYRIFRFYDSL